MVEPGRNQRNWSRRHPLELLDELDRFLSQLLESSSFCVLSTDVIGESERDIGGSVKGNRPAKEVPVEFANPTPSARRGADFKLS
jgi:hypothetical protein